MLSRENLIFFDRSRDYFEKRGAIGEFSLHNIFGWE
jgi:hypothetical protein